MSDLSDLSKTSHTISRLFTGRFILFFLSSAVVCVCFLYLTFSLWFHFHFNQPDLVHMGTVSVCIRKNGKWFIKSKESKIMEEIIICWCLWEKHALLAGREPSIPLFGTLSPFLSHRICLQMTVSARNMFVPLSPCTRHDTHTFFPFTQININRSIKNKCATFFSLDLTVLNYLSPFHIYPS